MRFDADRGIDALQVAVCDVLQDLASYFDQVLGADRNPARCVGRRTDAFDNVFSAFDNLVPIRIVEVPAGRSRLLGELASIAIERRQRITEEHAAHAFLRLFPFR